ncbi:MAG: hypothetical protein JXR22_12950 [Prolixibacteraceae bacterium]|nr:hypothetical protein [Prolixibacteraceae bacterium]
METKTLIDLIQIVSGIVTILGLPLALVLFFNEKRKERKEREYGTYNALDDKYIRFLELCLEKPELDVIEYPINTDVKLKDRQEQILFLILISNLERAFLMYHDQSNKIKESQWLGWVAYMKDYAKKDNFRKKWPELGTQFDKQFVEFMDSLMNDKN